MIQINALGWILQVDTKATMSHYETVTTDICDCAYCRNYVTAFPEHFPKRFLELLQKIGIDPLKPAHISEICVNSDNSHEYIGNYDFVGEVIKASDEQHQMRAEFNVDILGWSPKLKIQFSVTIPWVLSEEVESLACADLEI